ncbi:MAG: ABC transporter ATP-binding protein [Sphaerochaeta sp.]
MILEIKDLGFGYGNHKVISGLNLRISDGEMISLLGKNGAGKTTLLRLIPNFLKSSEGAVEIDGVPVKDMKLEERAKFMAYIPQLSKSAFPYSVKTSILMGSSNGLSFFQRPGRREEEKAERIIDILEIRHLENRNMDNISGGERQLVLIARALMQEAKLLILDEPTSFLDYSNQLLVLERIEELVKKGCSCIYSTHNPNLALTHSGRVIVMSEGAIVYDDVPEHLIGNNVLTDIYGRKIDIVKTEKGHIVCLPN